LPRFDFADARLVLALADAGSLGKAAAQLPLALSAASQRLRLLEERLGLTLFERSASGVKATDAGVLYLEHARRVLRVADQAQQAMDQLAHAGRVPLQVFANTTGSASELPLLLGRFLADWPQVDLILTECTSKDAVDAVLSGRGDLAVIDGHYSHAGLSLLPFSRDRLVVIAPSSHRLAQTEQCSFADLADEALIALPTTASLRQFLERMALLAQQSLRVRAEAQSFSAQIQLIASGLGVGIIPEAAARPLMTSYDVKLIAMVDEWSTRELWFAVRTGDEPTPLTQRLLEYLGAVRTPSSTAKPDAR